VTCFLHAFQRPKRLSVPGFLFAGPGFSHSRIGFHAHAGVGAFHFDGANRQIAEFDLLAPSE
jgi:hypothetical protein